MKTVVCLAVLALALRVAPAAAQDPSATAKVVTLPNGLRVLLAPDPAATVLDVTIWFDAGSRTEPEGRRGITNVIQRLLSRTPEVDRQTLALESRGGTTRTFTTPDVCGFSVTAPASALQAALELQTARMAEPPVSAELLASERASIREDRPRRPDASPNGRAVRRLFDRLQPETAYGSAVTGTDEDVARLAPKDCEEYFRARFGPTGAVLTVVGPFDAAEAERALAQTVGRVPKHGAPSARPAAKRGAAMALRLRESSDFQLPILFVGWRAPSAASADAAAFDLLGRLLTTGVSARLARALMTPELGGVFVQGGYDSRRDAGLLYTAVAVAPGADTAKVEKALISEVERLSTEPVTADELDRARRQAESNLLFAWQSSWSRAQALGAAQMVNGDWHAAWGRLDQIRKLTPEQLQRAAASALRPDARAVLWMTPAPGTEGGMR